MDCEWEVESKSEDSDLSSVIILNIVNLRDKIIDSNRYRIIIIVHINRGWGGGWGWGGGGGGGWAQPQPHPQPQPQPQYLKFRIYIILNKNCNKIYLKE